MAPHPNIKGLVEKKVTPADTHAAYVLVRYSLGQLVKAIRDLRDVGSGLSGCLNDDVERWMAE